jgi:hypothetical protein
MHNRIRSTNNKSIHICNTVDVFGASGHRGGAAIAQTIHAVTGGGLAYRRRFIRSNVGEEGNVAATRNCGGAIVVGQSD